jgi:hypothetical protein
MKKIPSLPLTLLLAPVLLAGCETGREPDRYYAACKALGSSDWAAYIEVDKEEKFPFPEEDTLVVSGTVKLPTGGYELSIGQGALVQLQPPVQQVILRTVAPQGMATQAITEQRVSGRLAFDRSAKSVDVRCGDATIARIPVITDRRAAEAPASAE